MNPSVHSKEMPEITDAQELADRLCDVGRPAADDEVRHVFTEGLYTRIAKVPAGHWAIGRIHRQKTLNILLKGDIIVYLAENQQPLVLNAPAMFESAEGVRKVVYALSDVEFANIHVTTETDLEKIEKQFIVPECDVPSMIADNAVNGFDLHMNDEALAKLTSNEFKKV